MTKPSGWWWPEEGPRAKIGDGYTTPTPARRAAVDLCYLPLLWQDCARSLVSYLHGRHAWRLAVLLCGGLFAKGRRTVTSWLRGAHVGRGFAVYYYFLATMGRRAGLLAGLLLRHGLRRLPAEGPALFALEDTPTQRYG